MSIMLSVEYTLCMKNSFKKSFNSKVQDKTVKRKEWKDYTRKEKRGVRIVLITSGVLILFWISSGFRTAIGMILLGYSVLYLVRAVRSRKTWKKSALIATILFIAVAIILPSTDKNLAVSDTTVSSNIQPKEDAAKLAEQKKLAEISRLEKEKKQLEDNQKKEAAAQQITTSGDLYKVTSITDGDTIKVDINGKIETLRFIGIDTPETKDPRKPVQCFGPEASSKMQSFVQSKSVRLASDATQDNRDKYGRLLRYVFLEDGRNVGYEMVKDGYAHEYTYDKPYKYQSQFKRAEQTAHDSYSGLWATTTCNGITNQELPPEPVAVPTPTYVPQPQPSSSVYYKNCTAVRAAGAAPIYAGQPGYGTHLDRDRDGIACE